MKKIINNPDQFVDEMVEGILLAHPDQVRTPGDDRRVLARADSPAPGRVGRRLRAKGRGFKAKGGDGDLLVIPEIVLPTELSAEAQEAFDKFVKLAPQENPRKDLLKKAK